MRSDHDGELTKMFNNSMFSNHIVPRSELTEGQNVRYFEEYKKLYYTAFCIQMQMKQFQKLSTDVKDKLHTVEKNIQICQKTDRNTNEKQNRHKPKRFRRTNQMIERVFRCAYPKCDKSYASEGSLQQHIRLKHEDSPPIYHHHHRQTKRQLRSQTPPESASEEDQSQYSQENSQDDEKVMIKKQEQS